jgi:hypothetical protein
MLARRIDAAWSADTESKMGGEGSHLKALDHDGWSSSSIAKDGVRGGGKGGRDQGGDQVRASRAWSDPRESVKETVGQEKGSIAKVISFARMRSSTDRWRSSRPFQVGTWGGESRVSPEVSNQSSKVAAKEEVVA